MPIDKADWRQIILNSAYRRPPFEPNEKSTLYCKENIYDQIQNQFKSELSSFPKNADVRENGTRYISTPRFLKKENQRVYWVSRITIEAKALKSSPSNIGTYPFVSLGPEGILRNSEIPIKNVTTIEFPMVDLAHTHAFNWQYDPYNVQSKSAISHIGLPSGWLSNIVANRKTLFDVTWSVIVGTNQKFRNPRIEGIQFAGTSWE